MYVEGRYPPPTRWTLRNLCAMPSFRPRAAASATECITIGGWDVSGSGGGPPHAPRQWFHWPSWRR